MRAAGYGHDEPNYLARRNIKGENDGNTSNNDNNASTTIPPPPTTGIRRKFNPWSPPTTVQIRNIAVHFPFKPYDVQVQYMTTVMDALTKSENALLESPTGTGKTLCLLCSALAWQKQEHKRLLQEKRESKKMETLNNEIIQLSQPMHVQQQQHHSQTTTASESTTSTRPGNDRKTSKPTIIYASRTHSQLAQVVRELRSTRYRPNHTVLGSREQMCVNPKVRTANSTPADINHACDKMCKTHSCRYKKKLEKGFTPPVSATDSNVPSKKSSQPVMDIEDLITMGRTSKVCPFYYTRGLLKDAELVLLPYNYLFDKDSRNGTLSDIPWENSIVIFDEAHNLEAFASESASFDLSSTDIAGCIAEVDQALKYVEVDRDGESASTIKENNLKQLKAIFLNLENYIEEKLDKTKEAYAGEFMIEIFEKGALIQFETHGIFIELCKRTHDLIMDLRGGGPSALSGNDNSAKRGGTRIEHFAQCIKRVFGESHKERCYAKARFYRVYVSPKEQPKTTAGASSNSFRASALSNDSGRTISYWCFAPAVAMKELADLNIRSIIVTSGTLSPLPSYSMELGLNFPHTIENPHIIQGDQIHVRIIGKGVSGKEMSSSYNRRNDGEYYSELGSTIVSLAKVVPAGMLIFFPSYSVMDTCLERWGGPSKNRKNNFRQANDSNKQNDFFSQRRRQKPYNNSNNSNRFSFPHAPISYVAGVSGASYMSQWDRLVATKAVVIEPKTSAELPDAIKEFERFLGMEKSTGCVLMGVCRGKISEGIDFANEQSRAVVITGLPFPPAFDPKVKMKREYLDHMKFKSNDAKASAEVLNDSGFNHSTPNASSAGMSTSSFSADKLSGNLWYTQQAHRAVNQAVGRVIRNQNDYGAVLLLDARFGIPGNQGGLSKWLRPHVRKDEGFGVAIRNLASFYAEADTKSKQREEDRKRLELSSPPPNVEYDVDDSDVDDDFGIRRYTVVNPDMQNDAISHESTDNVYHSSDGTAYVQPKLVVDRFEVDDLKIASSVATSSSFTNAKENLVHSNDAVFQTNVAPIDQGREQAIQFMAKVRAKIPSSEHAAIHKSLLAMKKSGEKKENEKYIQFVLQVVRIVVRFENFETPYDRDDKRMLFMFFAFLPKPMVVQAETRSYEVVFECSSMGIICKKYLSADDYKGIHSSMGTLLHLVWTQYRSKKALRTDESLRIVKDMYDVLGKYTHSNALQIISSFCKLIPAEFVHTVEAMYREVIAKKNIQHLKDIDKACVGENTVDSALFKLATKSNVESANEKEVGVPMSKETPVATQYPVLQVSHSQTTTISHAKRKIHEPFAVNPYARKKSLPSQKEQTPQTNRNPSIPVTRSPLQRLVNEKSPGVSKYLKNIVGETYIKTKLKGTDNKDEFMKRLQEKAPKDMECCVCKCLANDPCMADCGHTACLLCWLDWLKRSDTCVTCRQPTTKEQLSRIVYETQKLESATVAGEMSTIPKVFATPDDESEDELEIIKS